MADITIEAAAHGSQHRLGRRGGIFFTSATVGYLIFVNSANDLVYRKTSDGGSTWGDATPIVTGTVYAYDCWADWDTDGDAGTKINIACVDTDSDDILYAYLDTSDDSVGTDTIEVCQGTGAIRLTFGLGNHFVSITKTRGGNLVVAIHYQDTGSVNFYSFYTSPDGDTWTSKTSPWEAVADHLLLFPGNYADNQDLDALFWDLSANQISLKAYDNSGDSWSEQAIGTAVEEGASYLQMAGAVRLSDGHLILIDWNAYDAATADLECWDINGAGSITQKTNVLTDSAESFLCAIFINQANDDIYVVYARGTAVLTQVAVFYKKSTDGGTNWSDETAMQADAEDNIGWVSGGSVKSSWGGKFLPTWFNDDLDDIFCNTDNAITIAAAGGGAALTIILSDTVTITDSISKNFGSFKIDSVTVADSISKAPTKNLIDTMTISDAISKGIGIALSAVLTITDILHLLYPRDKRMSVRSMWRGKRRMGR